MSRSENKSDFLYNRICKEIKEDHFTEKLLILVKELEQLKKTKNEEKQENENKTEIKKNKNNMEKIKEIEIKTNEKIDLLTNKMNKQNIKIRNLKEENRRIKDEMEKLKTIIIENTMQEILKLVENLKGKLETEAIIEKSEPTENKLENIPTDYKTKIQEFVESKYVKYDYSTKDKNKTKNRITTTFLYDVISNEYPSLKRLKKFEFYEILISLGYTLKVNNKYIYLIPKKGIDSRNEIDKINETQEN
jgi:hypothetical protein